MMNDKRATMLNRIRQNIEKSGHHIYFIVGGASPRYAYTVGLRENTRFEVVLAGASCFMDKEVSDIVNYVASQLNAVTEWHDLSLELKESGVFSLREVNESWSERMLLGAMDYYGTTKIRALQIVPDRQHWTIDIPDLAQDPSSAPELAWRNLGKEWIYPVPKLSTAITNLDALRGEPITEATRWEENRWELFAGAGPDVPKEDIREVPLGMLLAVDPSLEAVVKLEIGKGIWRDSSDRKWHAWGKAND